MRRNPAECGQGNVEARNSHDDEHKAEAHDREDQPAPGVDLGLLMQWHVGGCVLGWIHRVSRSFGRMCSTSGRAESVDHDGANDYVSSGGCWVDGSSPSGRGLGGWASLVVGHCSGSGRGSARYRSTRMAMLVRSSSAALLRSSSVRLAATSTSSNIGSRRSKRSTSREETC